MEYFIAFFFGFALGIITGIFPGLHSNTVIAILVTSGIDKEAAAIMIAAICPAHIITSSIPSIFFNVPDPEAPTLVLPGHRMVIEGKGQLALHTVIFSLVISGGLAIVLFGSAISIYQTTYEMIKPHIKYILIALVAVFILRSKKPHWALAIFTISGLLGWSSLNSKLYDPFLPLFSGMFTIAAMLEYNGAVRGKTREGNNIASITHTTPTLDQNDLLGSTLKFVPFVLVGLVIGGIADLLPGVGSPSQMATLATIFVPVTTQNYLSLVSSISISQVIFSLATSISIDKSRVGATAWLDKITNIENNISNLLFVFGISMVLAACMIYLIKKYITRLSELDFSSLNLVIGAYLVCISYIFDGFWGIVIIILSAMLGWLTIRLNVERTNLMGAVLLPTLMLLFKIFI